MGTGGGEEAIAITGKLSLMTMSPGHLCPWLGWTMQPPHGVPRVAGTQQWASSVGTACRDLTLGCGGTSRGTSSLVGTSVGCWEQGRSTKLGHPCLPQGW